MLRSRLLQQRRGLVGARIEVLVLVLQFGGSRRGRVGVPAREIRAQSALGSALGGAGEFLPARAQGRRQRVALDEPGCQGPEIVVRQNAEAAGERADLLLALSQRLSGLLGHKPRFGEAAERVAAPGAGFPGGREPLVQGAEHGLGVLSGKVGRDGVRQRGHGGFELRAVAPQARHAPHERVVRGLRLRRIAPRRQGRLRLCGGRVAGQADAGQGGAERRTPSLQRLGRFLHSRVRLAGASLKLRQQRVLVPGVVPRLGQPLDLGVDTLRQRGKRQAGGGGEAEVGQQTFEGGQGGGKLRLHALETQPALVECRET